MLTGLLVTYLVLAPLTGHDGLLFNQLLSSIAPRSETFNKPHIVITVSD